MEVTEPRFLIFSTSRNATNDTIPFSDALYMLTVGVSVAILIAGALGLSLAAVARTPSIIIRRRKRSELNVLEASHSKKNYNLNGSTEIIDGRKMKELENEHLYWKTNLNLTESTEIIDDRRMEELGNEHFGYDNNDPMLPEVDLKTDDYKQHRLRRSLREQLPNAPEMNRLNFLEDLKKKFDRYFSEGNRYLHYLLNNEFDSELEFILDENESEKKCVDADGEKNICESEMESRWELGRRGFHYNTASYLAAETEVMQAVKVADSFGCGKKMICELAAANQDSLTLDHLAMLDLIGSAVYPANSTVGHMLDPKLEYRLARGVGTMGHNCSAVYPLCPLNDVAELVDSFIRWSPV